MVILIDGYQIMIFDVKQSLQITLAIRPFYSFSAYSSWEHLFFLTNKGKYFAFYKILYTLTLCRLQIHMHCTKFLLLKSLLIIMFLYIFFISNVESYTYVYMCTYTHSVTDV